MWGATVPEAAIDEHRNLRRAEHDVARQERDRDIDSEAQSTAVESERRRNSGPVSTASHSFHSPRNLWRGRGRRFTHLHHGV
jgi:hypothetical protein